MFGFAGAHRTGKSTLAEAVSKETDLPLVLTSSSAVFKKYGIDPSKPMDFATRLKIQHEILDNAMSVWANENGPFITDRTPVDMLAYTLMDVKMNTNVDMAELERYAQRCYDAIGMYFCGIFIVQPGIPLVYEEGKAALNEAYIEALNTMILGVSADQRLGCTRMFIRRENTDLSDRVNIVCEAIEVIRERHEEDHTESDYRLQ